MLALYLLETQILRATFLSQLPACTDDFFEIKMDVKLDFACLQSFLASLYKLYHQSLEITDEVNVPHVDLVL